MADRSRLDGLDAELLDRYLAGECSQDELAAVRRYLMTRPDVARALERFVAGLDAADERPPAPDSRASWAELRRRIRPAEDRGAGRTPPPSTAARGARRRRPSFSSTPFAPRRRSWATRAALGAVVAAGALGVVALERAESRDVGRAAPPPARVYETTARQRAELRLDDGTRVRLAPASRLRVATDFGTERRDVYLEGEAYFDVAHDARRPFTVYAGNASARDLGTSFSARAYAEDGAVQVVVRDGEVALSGVGRLTAGDLGRLGAEGAASVRRGVDVDALLGWVDGRLEFRDARLGRVAQDLGRWYGVDLRLDDPALGALPFTGTLTGLPADAAIDVVAATLGLRARRGDDGRVVLQRIPGRTPRSARRRSSDVARAPDAVPVAASVPRSPDVIIPP